MALTLLGNYDEGTVASGVEVAAEFNQILNSSLSLISPLTGNLAAGGNDITGIDELALDNGAADATATGRIRRNAQALTWHDGNAARTIPMVLDRDVTANTVASSSSTTSVYSFTLPANTLLTNRAIKVTAILNYTNNNATTADFSIALGLGSTTFASLSMTNVPTSASSRRLIFTGMISGLNATGSQIGYGQLTVSGAGEQALASDIPNGAGSIANALLTAINTGTEDTTTALSLTLNVAHDASSANQSVTCHVVQVELL